MINIALNQAYINSGLATAIGTNYDPPYFYLDAVTNLIHLVVPFQFDPEYTSLNNLPFIFMNEPLNTYLSGFPTVFNEYDSPVGKDYIFNMEYRHSQNFFYPNGTTQPTPTDPASAVPAGATGPTGPSIPYYFRYSQEYSSLNIGHH